MAKNICNALIAAYPTHANIFDANYLKLEQQLNELQLYGSTQLKDISCRKLITFHDGFSYFAKAFDLTIVKAVEEESGAEASAAELIELIEIVNEEQLPAIFIERNGSNSAANVVARETGADIFMLDMCISGNSYFDAMYHNINTIKEALE